jgi:hypothetical protein
MECGGMTPLWMHCGSLYDLSFKWIVSTFTTNTLPRRIGDVSVAFHGWRDMPSLLADRYLCATMECGGMTPLWMHCGSLYDLSFKWIVSTFTTNILPRRNGDG